MIDFSFLFLLDLRHQNKAWLNASMCSVQSELADNKTVHLLGCFIGHNSTKKEQTLVRVLMTFVFASEEHP